MKSKCDELKKDIKEANALFSRVEKEFQYKEETAVKFFQCCNALDTAQTGEFALKKIAELAPTMKELKKLDKVKRPSSKRIKARAKAGFSCWR